MRFKLQYFKEMSEDATCVTYFKFHMLTSLRKKQPQLVVSDGNRERRTLPRRREAAVEVPAAPGRGRFLAFRSWDAAPPIRLVLTCAIALGDRCTRIFQLWKRVRTAASELAQRGKLG